MGYVLQDRMEVSLFLSGVEFPLSGINVLNSLQVDMSVKVLLPTIHLVVTDEMELISKSSLVQDGTPLSVVMKPWGAGDAVTYNFRVFKYQSFRATIGTMYQIDGYLDFPKFWFQTSTEGIQGTSNQVLSEITRVCGMQYDGTNTNDSQIWFPQNRTYGIFAKKTVEHGYASDTSLMMFGVDFSGTLMYRDFNQQPDTAIDIVLGQYTNDARVATDYIPKNDGGLNNMLSGYNNIRVAQSAVGSTIQTTVKDLQFFPDSKTPFFNDELKAQTERGFVLYSPIDFGNVHESYERAYYQNQRYKNLMNAGVDFMSIMPTGLNLFDSFNFVDREVEDHEVNNSWSGKYRVTSKAIRVEGATYSEYFEGYRHGTNVT